MLCISCMFGRWLYAGRFLSVGWLNLPHPVFSVPLMLSISYLLDGFMLSTSCLLGGLDAIVFLSVGWLKAFHVLSVGWP